MSETIILSKKVKVYQKLLEEVLPKIFSAKIKGNALTLNQILGRTVHIAYFENESTPVFVEEKIKQVFFHAPNGELDNVIFYFQEKNNPLRELVWYAKTGECFILSGRTGKGYHCIIIG